MFHILLTLCKVNTSHSVFVSLRKPAVCPLKLETSEEEALFNQGIGEFTICKCY